MSNKAIVTDKAPAALGPYSAAVQAGNCIHVSGQLPVDPATGAFEVAALPKAAKVEIKAVAYL